MIIESIIDELKPCPFCGASAKVCGEEFLSSRSYYVACMNEGCYCALGEGYDRDACPDHSFITEQQAIDAWNKRT